ncbi:uncharacterized protein LOC115760389 [Drosophila novamexicana]|uniref:uncharacterized protein LOC115760389 n=1 Tax=Drosophila novamexicana TaxID=47314 RepID=UPI0011E5EDD5|nr:uncharacterized protein LOC115760389 [Drosophila novamexicana]
MSASVAGVKLHFADPCQLVRTSGPELYHRLELVSLASVNLHISLYNNRTTIKKRRHRKLQPIVAGNCRHAEKNVYKWHLRLSKTTERKLYESNLSNKERAATEFHGGGRLPATPDTPDASSFDATITTSKRATKAAGETTPTSSE